jgi:hypothetical protein
MQELWLSELVIGAVAFFVFITIMVMLTSRSESAYEV